MSVIKEYEVYYAVKGGEVCLKGHDRNLPEGERYQPYEPVGILYVEKGGSYSFKPSIDMERYLSEFNDCYTIEMMKQLFESVANEV